jgi:hypothetical protein
MKSLTVRALVAFACASLVACGGNSGTLQLTGTISGLNKPGLVLANGSDTVSVTNINATTTFAFGKLLNNDDFFQVSVQTQPTGGKCVFTGTLASADGTHASSNASIYTVSNIFLSCAADPYHLGGTITGPHDGLVLINGSDQLSPPADATTFTFSQTVGNGSAYGVTVFNQPPGHTCTVANGIGTLGAADVNTVQVNCI